MSIFSRLLGLPVRETSQEQPRRSAGPRLVRKVIIEGGCNSGFDLALEFPDFSEVSDFFSQRPLPYLWPDNDSYRQSIDEQEYPQDVLREQWTVAFLSHPNSNVVLATLQMLDLKFRTTTLTICLALLLAYGEDAVARETARVVWTGNDWTLEQIIDLLGDGNTPSGIEPEKGKRGTQLLLESCPATRISFFKELAQEVFGPEAVGQLDELDLFESTNRLLLEQARSWRNNNMVEINHYQKPSDPNVTEIHAWLEEAKELPVAQLPDENPEMNESDLPIYQEEPEIAPAEIHEESMRIETLETHAPQEVVPEINSKPKEVKAENTVEAEPQPKAVPQVAAENLNVADPLLDQKKAGPKLDEFRKEKQMFDDAETAYESPLNSFRGRQHYFASDSSQSEEIGRAYQRLQAIDAEINSLLLAAARIGRLLSNIGATLESSPESLLFEDDANGGAFGMNNVLSRRDEKDIDARRIHSLVYDYRSLLKERRQLAARLNR